MSEDSSYQIKMPIPAGTLTILEVGLSAYGTAHATSGFINCPNWSVYLYCPEPASIGPLGGKGETENN